MKWEVTGTDEKTGTPRIILVDAASESEAVALGQYNGLIVGEARRQTAQVIPYAEPAPKVQQAPARRSPPTITILQPEPRLPGHDASTMFLLVAGYGLGIVAILGGAVLPGLLILIIAALWHAVATIIRIGRSR